MLRRSNKEDDLEKHGRKLMCVNTSSQSLPLLASSCVNSVCFAAVYSRLLLLFKFVHIIDVAGLLSTLLHDAPNLVVNWVQVRAVGQPQISSDEVGGQLQ